MMFLGSRRSDPPSLEQIDFGATIHLTFHELEPIDVAFGLPVRPRFGDCGTNSVVISFMMPRANEATRLLPLDARWGHRSHRSGANLYFA